MIKSTVNSLPTNFLLVLYYWFSLVEKYLIRVATRFSCATSILHTSVKRLYFKSVIK